MLNKKGLGFVDIIVGLTLLSATLLMTYQFLTFLKDYKDVHSNTLIVVQLMNNEVERAYRTDLWSGITGGTFETARGTATSAFTEYSITGFHTEQMKVEVILGEFSENIYIERSVHYNE